MPIINLLFIICLEISIDIIKEGLLIPDLVAYYFRDA